MIDMFNKVSIIGAGLIGGSIGKAVKAKMPSCKVSFYDKSPLATRKAIELGLADQAAKTIAQCILDADIVIIAAPVRAFKGIFHEIKSDLKSGTIVTDAGSTKMIVSDWAKEILGDGVFIGSHPIAGSEKTGIENSAQVCIDGAQCIITPLEANSQKQIDDVCRFWQLLGMKTVIMAPEKHDSMYAVLSHLPHAVAAALVKATDPEIIQYAGAGFRDTTRIAEGGADIWTDIFVTNSTNMLQGIDKIIENLEKLKFYISNNYLDELKGFFEETREKRKKIDK